MLEKLIGAQILSVGDDYITVKKGEEVLMLEIIADDGDCCGYADFKTNLMYEPNSLRNPVITNVTHEIKENSGEESTVVTFYGEYKPLATVESEAGSGSGWGYGSFVALQCKALDLDETLASW